MIKLKTKLLKTNSFAGCVLPPQTKVCGGTEKNTQPNGFAYFF